jgi:hypothetical protein
MSADGPRPCRFQPETAIRGAIAETVDCDGLLTRTRIVQVATIGEDEVHSHLELSARDCMDSLWCVAGRAPAAQSVLLNGDEKLTASLRAAAYDWKQPDDISAQADGR